MYLLRFVISRFVVFWLSVAILVYGWMTEPQVVNNGIGFSETLVKKLARLESTGKAETVAVHILHVGDLIVIGAIMLVVTIVLTALRNLVLGSGQRRMTVMRAIAQVIVLLLLAYAILAAVWWYDAPRVNAWFDASRALMAEIAAKIDPRGQLDLIFRTLGLARHLVVGCIMLALALAWEILKAAGRGAASLAGRGADR